MAKYLKEEDREEALKVLRFLGVPEKDLKYISCCYEGGWMHRYTGFLGGRDGWSGLQICRDFEDDEEIMSEREYDEDNSFIIVDSIEYYIHEVD